MGGDEGREDRKGEKGGMIGESGIWKRYERAVGEEVRLNGRGIRWKGKERRLGTPQRSGCWKILYLRP